MRYDHDKSSRPGRAKEPVQVYLAGPDQDRLARLTTQLGATKSDVLRRGMEALERELSDPEDHPAVRVIGLAGEGRTGTGPDYDVAHEHDRYLAESEIASWRAEGDGADGP